MPTRTRLFAAGFLVLLATMKARSDDTELVAKQLAAIKSLRSQISRHSYRLPDDKVRELVIALLRRDETKVPKAMPPMEKLRSDLDVDFESAWNDMINKATAGLDMKGNLELINEIRGFLKDSGIRSAAQAGHDKFVKEELPASLDRVRKQIVEEQTTELRQALTGLIEAGTLTQELVIDASQNGTAAGVGLLTRSVLEKVSEATRETLLVNSFETLSEQAEQIVADGTEQLKEQQEVLGETPVAVSQQAIHTEFETELAPSPTNRRWLEPALRCCQFTESFLRSRKLYQAKPGSRFANELQKLAMASGRRSPMARAASLPTCGLAGKHGSR